MFYKTLLQPGRIGKMELKNRFIMGPMGHGFCDETNGHANERLIEFFRQRAKGGYSLIDLGAVQIDPEYNTNEGIMKLYDDSYIPSMRNLTDAVHKEGGKIMAQLLHQGRYANSREYGDVGKAPSAVYSNYTRETPREMSTEEVERLVEYYRQAAERAVKAGFDAVEISTNSGYLIGQFLSPLTNLRIDKYGGTTLEERMTFMHEVIAAVRNAVGPDFPVVIRICSSDLVNGSNINDDACKVAMAAEEDGVDAIHVTGGWHEATVPQATMDVPHGTFAYFAKRIKDHVNMPIILCNRMNVDFAARVIYEGMADFVAFARPSIADPEMPNKVLQCRINEIRPCVGCNQGCLDMRMRHKKISCLVNAEVGRESELIHDGKMPTQVRSETPENILVVGAGPAGMEFARVAANRGHSVTIWEKSDRTGGQIELNSVPPGRHDFAYFGAFLRNEMKRLGVNICLNKEATAEEIIADVKEGKFDRVVIACGALPITPSIPTSENANVCQAWDVLRKKILLGKNVVIVGGGAVGVETAEYIAKMGTITPEVQQFLMNYDAESIDIIKEMMHNGTKKVAVIEMGKRIGADIGPTTRWSMMARLRQHGVTMLKLTKVIAINDHSVEVEDADGNRTSIPADTVVLAVGSRSVNHLYSALEGKVDKLDLIGDSIEPAFIIDAVRSAYDAAYSI